MKNKKISVTLFAALLLVMSAASTAFAGTVTANGGCGTSINGQEEYVAESRPGTVIKEEIAVKVIINPQGQGNKVFQEPGKCQVIGGNLFIFLYSNINL